MSDEFEISERGISCSFDRRTGLLKGFEVQQGHRTIAPLHKAPWVDTAELMPDGAPPHLATLGGDFLCAPFANVEGDCPIHGWTANAPWEVVAFDGGMLRAKLSRRVMGATVTKELSLRPQHPFVYQRHLFTNGQGRLPVSNHANVSVLNGAILSFSPKAFWETPRDAQESDPERGRSALVYSARASDPSEFPGVNGTVNLTRYPWVAGHEDFVIGVEAEAGFAWTAVVRPVEGDVFLSFHNAGSLPMTMLWHSDGGRDYAPWSGRHRGCLGVEIGAADHMLAIAGSEDLAGPGALDLASGKTCEVRHVIGAHEWPTGEPIEDVSISSKEAVTIKGSQGAIVTAPLDTTFFVY